MNRTMQQPVGFWRASGLALMAAWLLALSACGGGNGNSNGNNGNGNNGGNGGVTITAPVAQTQPVNASVEAGQSASFSFTATATGEAPGYQWQQSGDGGATWTDIAGATASSYTTPATSESDDGRQFRAIATNSAGSVSSLAAVLAVAAASTGGGGGFAGYYTVGGHMQGLLADMSWTGLRLYVTPPGGSRTYYDITVDANGSFVFSGVVPHPQTGASAYFDAAPFPAGSQYEVSLGNAPFRRCSIANGSGTLNADVSNISVSCQPLWVETIATAMADKVVQGAVVHDAPSSIASDPAGNLYVGGVWLDDYASFRECYLRKIAVDGSDSVLVAGSCDGTGPVPFRYPVALAAAGDGTVYLNAGNASIYQWNGSLSLLAGAGERGFADGTGAAARFDDSTGVLGLAVDASGTVYVGDVSNQRIRQITPAGVVTTLAGDGSITLWNAPQGVAVDGNGVVYVANYAKNEISTVATTTVAGSGISGLSNPKYVAATPAGDVHVLQTNVHSIVQRQAGSYLETAAAGVGNVPGTNDGRADQARFSALQGIASDAAARVFVLDRQPVEAGGYVTVIRRLSTTVPAPAPE